MRDITTKDGLTAALANEAGIDQSRVSVEVVPDGVIVIVTVQDATDQEATNVAAAARRVLPFWATTEVRVGETL